jgi:hypothetical protein
LVPLAGKHRRQGKGHKQREQRCDGNRHTKASEELTDDPSVIVTPRMNEFSADPLLSWMFERAAELRKSDD